MGKTKERRLVGAGAKRTFLALALRANMERTLYARDRTSSAVYVLSKNVTRRKEALRGKLSLGGIRNGSEIL